MSSEQMVSCVLITPLICLSGSVLFVTGIESHCSYVILVHLKFSSDCWNHVKQFHTDTELLRVTFLLGEACMRFALLA